MPHHAIPLTVTHADIPHGAILRDDFVNAASMRGNMPPPYRKESSRDIGASTESAPRRRCRQIFLSAV